MILWTGFGVLSADLEVMEDMLTEFTPRHCYLCDKEMGIFYNWHDYTYKYYGMDKRIKKYNMLYFCSWTCYRRYLNERNRQNKLNNFPKEVH